MGVMETDSRTCPECAGQNLYATTVGSAGGHGPVLLPGLGGFLHFAKFNVTNIVTEQPQFIPNNANAAVTYHVFNIDLLRFGF